MMTNIKRVRPAGRLAEDGIPMYCPEKDKNGDYGIGEIFQIGIATAGRHKMVAGAYEVTSAVDKQLFKVVGEKEVGAALTGRAKMKAEFTCELSAAMIIKGWAPGDETQLIAEEMAENIIKDNES